MKHRWASGINNVLFHNFFHKDLIDVCYHYYKFARVHGLQQWYYFVNEEEQKWLRLCASMQHY